MKLITVATHSERYFPYLKVSAEKYGHELIVLGWGEKWKGLIWKFELMREYLKGLDQNEVVCFVDGFDVLILEDPKTIEEKFLKNIKGDKNKILISREEYSDKPIENTFLLFLQSLVYTKCKNEYINSGTYMGVVSTLVDLFQNMCGEFKCISDYDDQRMIQEYCKKHTSKFVIDTNCDVFLVINSTVSAIKPGEYHIKINNGKLSYKDNTYPSIIHANGYTNIDYLISELGYDTSIFKAEDESKAYYFWKMVKYYTPTIFKRFWPFILITISLLIYAYRLKIKSLFTKGFGKRASIRKR